MLMFYGDGDGDVFCFCLCFVLLCLLFFLVGVCVWFLWFVFLVLRLVDFLFFGGC